MRGTAKLLDVEIEACRTIRAAQQRGLRTNERCRTKNGTHARRCRAFGLDRQKQMSRSNAEQQGLQNNECCKTKGEAELLVEHLRGPAGPSAWNDRRALALCVDQCSLQTAAEQQNND